MKSKYLTDLETSKRLISVGIGKESSFFWFKPNYGSGYEIVTNEVKNKVQYSKVMPAYLLSELKEIAFELSHLCDWEQINQHFEDFLIVPAVKQETTELQAWAEFVIYLKGEKQ